MWIAFPWNNSFIWNLACCFGHKTLTHSLKSKAQQETPLCNRIPFIFWSHFNLIFLIFWNWFCIRGYTIYFLTMIMYHNHDIYRIMHLSNFKKIQAQKNLNVNISRFGHVHKKKAYKTNWYTSSCPIKVGV